MEFRFRSAVLLTFFVLWAVIALFTLYRRTVTDGESLLNNSESFARREGVLPAARGRILDANGVPLAWTEIHFALFLRKSQNGISSKLKAFLATRFQITEIPDFLPDQEEIMLMDELPVNSEKELEILFTIPEQFPSLRVRTRHCRIHVDYPQVAARLGECTEDENGIPHGISGWEKEFDRELSGSAGTFTVMRDRKDRWMPGTIRMKKMPSPGKDITLDVPLADLIGKEDDRIWKK